MECESELANLVSAHRTGWNLPKLLEQAESESAVAAAEELIRLLPSHIVVDARRKLRGLPYDAATLSLAMCLYRRGKGGRRQGDNPLCDPNKSPAQAQRILNNRRSAAVSKLNAKIGRLAGVVGEARSASRHNLAISSPQGAGSAVSSSTAVSTPAGSEQLPSSIFCDANPSSKEVAATDSDEQARQLTTPVADTSLGHMHAGACLQAFGGCAVTPFAQASAAVIASAVVSNENTSQAAGTTSLLATSPSTGSMAAAARAIANEPCDTQLTTLDSLTSSFTRESYALELSRWTTMPDAQDPGAGFWNSERQRLPLRAVSVPHSRAVTPDLDNNSFVSDAWMVSSDTGLRMTSTPTGAQVLGAGLDSVCRDSPTCTGPTAACGAVPPAAAHRSRRQTPRRQPLKASSFSGRSSTCPPSLVTRRSRRTSSGAGTQPSAHTEEVHAMVHAIKAQQHMLHAAKHLVRQRQQGLRESSPAAQASAGESHAHADLPQPAMPALSLSPAHTALTAADATAVDAASLMFNTAAPQVSCGTHVEAAPAQTWGAGAASAVWVGHSSGVNFKPVSAASVVQGPAWPGAASVLDASLPPQAHVPPHWRTCTALLGLGAMPSLSLDSGLQSGPWLQHTQSEHTAQQQQCGAVATSSLSGAAGVEAVFSRLDPALVAPGGFSTPPQRDSGVLSPAPGWGAGAAHAATAGQTFTANQAPSSTTAWLYAGGCLQDTLPSARDQSTLCSSAGQHMSSVASDTGCVASVFLDGSGTNWAGESPLVPEAPLQALPQAQHSSAATCDWQQCEQAHHLFESEVVNLLDWFDDDIIQAVTQ